jgi:molybdate transport system substrate-binding protein
MMVMHRRPTTSSLRGLLALLAFLVASAASAAEIRVVSSGGFNAACRQLAPEFERATGHKVTLGFGPSMGDTQDAIPARLKRNEPIDVVVMVGSALGKLIDEGKIVSDSRVDLAQSAIGMVVRKGAPRPDISTVEALKRTLLEAKSIAYSDSASGVYIANELFKRLGIADQVKPKSRMIPAIPVAEIVARGQAEIGFQQISELLPVPGVDLVGRLPPEVQRITVFAAGIVVGSKEPDAARAFITFVASPAASTTIEKTGLEQKENRASTR